MKKRKKIRSKKSKKSLLYTLKNESKYWYKKDENGQIHKTSKIIFEMIIFLPFIIFEGIKVGFYSKLVTEETGFQVMIDGLQTPFWKIYELGENKTRTGTGFGSTNISFNGNYLFLFILFYVSVFALMYIAAERNKNKSQNKDGDMKFGNIAEFNEAMAYCDKNGKPIDPAEDTKEPGNMILSKHVRYSLEPKNTNTYSCALVVGATGCGKTFTYVKPNILQMNSSYVITDPKGELVRDLGKSLMENGYNVKIFNINEPEYSCKYNPFKYIRCEADVVTAVNVFLDNTKEQNSTGGDAFFPIAEKNFYLGLFFYIYTVYKDEPEKQTFKTIYELYQAADEQEVVLKKGEKIPESAFDKLFIELSKKDPTNPAIGYYATFKKGTNKTRQAILISVGVKLWFLSVGSIANLMSDDTLELEKIGDRKTALFIVIPSEKKTFKFLSAMLFTQIFETLYYVGNTLNEKSFFIQKGNCVAIRSKPFIAGTKSEEEAKNNLEIERELWKNATIEDDNELMKTDENLKKYFDTPNEYGFKPFPKVRVVYKDKNDGHKRVLEEFQSRVACDIVMNVIQKGEIVKGEKTLVNHVRFMLDEFFSNGIIQDFDLKIATFRSLRISCDIIVQSIAQLREMYEDRESKITNNCSIQILLGAASLDDCKYFSDLIGQTTVRSESTSINHKGLIQGVDNTSLSDNAQMLIRPEKIRTLNKDRCLILVNTKMPLWDDKYFSINHKRWKETYSDHDKNLLQNEFQFRRLFFIKQEDKNRIVTKLNLSDANSSSKLSSIQGKQVNEENDSKRYGIEPLKNAKSNYEQKYPFSNKEYINVNNINITDSDNITKAGQLLVLVSNAIKNGNKDIKLLFDKNIGKNVVTMNEDKKKLYERAVKPKASEKEIKNKISSEADMFN